MRTIYPLMAVLSGGAVVLFAAEKPAPVGFVVPVSTAPEFPVKLPTFDEADIPGWTRVNEKARHKMPASVSHLCIQLPQNAERGDHAGAFVEVFVNDIGKTAMFSEPVANPAKPEAAPAILFPVGTVIIKVKYADSTGGSPLLRTTMVKRVTGHNPTCGDWEFVASNGDGQKVSERGKIQRCMDCHERHPATDFTFINDYRPRPPVPKWESLPKTEPKR